MLPGSSSDRIGRDQYQREGPEISRLIGRALRSVVDLRRWGNAWSGLIAMSFKPMEYPNSCDHRRMGGAA